MQYSGNSSPWTVLAVSPRASLAQECPGGDSPLSCSQSCPQLQENENQEESQARKEALDGGKQKGTNLKNSAD